MVPLRRLVKKEKVASRIWGIDPGQTTGVCLMRCGELIHTGQLATKDLSPTTFLTLQHYIETYRPNEIACEDYKVYDWKSDEHKWSELHTAKLIGAITFLAVAHKIPIKMRMALTAKTFVTDDKLRLWGFYVKGQRHARDAIRHALYQTIFGEAG